MKIWFFTNQLRVCDIKPLSENIKLTSRCRSIKLRFCSYGEFSGPEFVTKAIPKKNTISHKLELERADLGRVVRSTVSSNPVLRGIEDPEDAMIVNPVSVNPAWNSSALR